MAKRLYISPVVPFKCLWAASYQFNSAFPLAHRPIMWLVHPVIVEHNRKSCVLFICHFNSFWTITLPIISLPFLLHASSLCQSPSTRSTKWQRVVSQMYSIGMEMAASTQSAVLRCTMEITWNLSTWWHQMLKKPEPGWPASAIWWPGSVMKTRWPSGSALMTNIL